MHLAALCVSAGIVITCANAARAGDWPQYNGPHHDRSSTEEVALKPWGADGPSVKWRVKMATGFSSLSVVDGTAYTLERREVGGAEMECCLALDVETGEERWTRALVTADYPGGGDAGASDNSGGDGPRSTPSVSGDRVFVLDADLNLWCLATANGEVIWSKELIGEYGGRNIRWKNAASPLLHDGLVIVPGGGAGQSLLAFRQEDGEVRWKVLDEMMTHATPIVATLHSVPQVIFFVQSGLVSVSPKDGEELWRAPFDYKISTAASPVVDGGLVYCSAGYGVGAGAFELTHDGGSWEARNSWRRRNKLQNHWSTPLAHGGMLYGMFSFKKYGTGPLKCVDLKTGEEKWSADGYGPGNCILVGDLLIALSDTGEVALVQARSDEYRELCRADVLKGKCWSTPSYAEGRIFVRSTMEAVCIDIGVGAGR